MHLLTLSDNWQIRPLDQFLHGIYPRSDEGWRPAVVPAHWQQLAGLETHVGNVVYRCQFALDSDPEPTPTRYWLRLNGAFYWSQPYLNGVDLGRHEGYFAPYEREVTAWIKRNNQVLIEVACPDERDKFNKHMITGVFSHWDCFDPEANPGGLWLPVEIQRSGRVRLQGMRLHSESFDARVANLRFRVDLDASSAGPVLLRWTFTPRTFDGPVQIYEQKRTLWQGSHTIGGLLKLREPRLWWTHDLGNPDLYTVRLEVWTAESLSDVEESAFGIRRFELRNWIPYLNGERFLAKGSNYPPGDMRIATMNRARCDEDFRLVRECHMNMLRIHAHVDHPALYAAADAAGVLLWQDMPLQWLYHPSVLGEAQRQARAMVRLLYNHPSIAIWCMHNEPLHVAETNDEGMLTRLRTYKSVFSFSWNRDLLDLRLKQIVEHEDPRRPAIRSSGEIAVPGVRDGTDAHTYFGWYQMYGGLEMAEQARRRLPANLRFVTEFGAQSFPNLESCLKFMPAEVREIDFDLLTRRHSFQGEIMANWIPWRSAQSLDELITMSQDYQIMINRYYVDRLRYHKYAPTGGIIPFLFLDPYPAILWSVVDYWRQPKRSYTELQLAFSPQYAFTLIEPRTYLVGEAIDVPLYAVNDARHPVTDLVLTAQLRDPTGQVLATICHAISLPADCTTQTIDQLRLITRMPGDYVIEIALEGGTVLIRQAYVVKVARDEGVTE